ncbi:MAG: N-6 DNA methylase [Phycisphaerales bacterium]|nr:N-6 DNA methylase [Phycisphaerales bacterium]
MALDFLRYGHLTLSGPALPEPFVRFELERALAKLRLLPDSTGLSGQKVGDEWRVFQRKVRDISANSGPLAISNKVLDPLTSRLGYATLDDAPEVQTREGLESGGALMNAAATGSDAASPHIRCWTTDFDADLDAPTKRGHAYRYSPTRIAQRVLLASGERLGLLTNGTQLRLLICDPARPDSFLEFDLTAWAGCRELPDSYLLLLALASPAGAKALPDIVEEARLKQNKVTKELRHQARLAVEEFVQSIIDNDANRARLSAAADTSALAKQLWQEGLVVVYRLLFILKCETTSDPSRVFRFASSTLWRNTYSPSTALARVVRMVLDEGAQSGRFLEDGLRILFTMFEKGVDHPGLTVRPLGGALFGAQSAPLLAELKWGEQAVAHLLDRLLWTSPKRGSASRERVHYGPLDVEDLGRVYEALLELEPGISTEPMCRLRRQKLEVVVPAAQGEKYKPAIPAAAAPAAADDDADVDAADNADDVDGGDDDAPARGKKTKVEWIEAIPPGRFYLRVGLGRKASGSYYTPHSFVRFLVQETLGPQCAERSPPDDPNPGEILKLKVLDPACGSGHFLVEACRFLAARLYESARLCDEQASELEAKAEVESDALAKQKATERAAELRRRLKDLPDAEDELLSYLPGRSPEGGITGFSQAKAEGICRRLVAVHCIYGVDMNPLAVELAKLALWIESHAEGFPLTFLDHRIVLGNSLTGPFWDKLTLAPGTQQPVANLFRQNLDRLFTQRLSDALSLVRDLEAGVGVDVDELRKKQSIKDELDRKLMPFRILAAAWTGGVMLGTAVGEGDPACDDDAYAALLKTIGETGDVSETIEDENLLAMIGRGLGLPPGVLAPSARTSLVSLLVSGQVAAALPYDLAFPEVFHPTGIAHGRHGFDAVAANPPWDAIQFKSKEFFAAFDFEILNAPTKRERDSIENRLTADPVCGGLFAAYTEGFEQQKRIIDALFEHQKVFIDGDLCGRQLDLFRVFMERHYKLLNAHGWTGVVVPSAFHANEGATGVRRLYLNHMRLHCCYSFENRRRLFEIHASFKFATVIAQRGEPTRQFQCAFYLHDDEWLFADDGPSPPLLYTRQFVENAGGEYLAFVELQRRDDSEVVQTITAAGLPFRRLMSRDSLRFSREFDVGSDEPYVRQDLKGFPIVEGKCFHQYRDDWEPPHASIDVTKLERANPSWATFRLTFRRIASSTNERTSIWAVLPPGCVGADSNPIEQDAHRRPTVRTLVPCAVANAFSFDFQLRLRVGANVQPFLVELCTMPALSADALRFLAHSTIRLSCNHAGYEPLWREQLGDAWREYGLAPFSWPALNGDEKRWATQGAVDAAVADAYGLSREQYAHVLSTFSHKSYPKAPQQCLAAFDELKAIGLEAFCKKHDPYWDIPLNESLPKPVIDLPTPSAANGAPSEGASGRRGRRRNGASAESGPALWEQKDGQITLESPGPIFDEGAAAAKASTSPSPGAIAGQVAAIKTLLGLRKVITNADVQGHLKCDPATARAVLKQLVESGAAVVEGKAKGTKYRAAGKA